MVGRHVLQNKLAIRRFQWVWGTGWWLYLCQANRTALQGTSARCCFLFTETFQFWEQVTPHSRISPSSLGLSEDEEQCVWGEEGLSRLELSLCAATSCLLDRAGSPNPPLLSLLPQHEAPRRDPGLSASPTAGQLRRHAQDLRHRPADLRRLCRARVHLPGQETRLQGAAGDDGRVLGTLRDLGGEAAPGAGTHIPACCFPPRPQDKPSKETHQTLNSLQLATKQARAATSSTTPSLPLSAAFAVGCSLPPPAASKGDAHHVLILMKHLCNTHYAIWKPLTAWTLKERRPLLLSWRKFLWD